MPRDGLFSFWQRTTVSVQKSFGHGFTQSGINLLMPEATPDIWSVDLGRGMGVIHLGAPLADVVDRLKSGKIDLDGDDELDDGWLYVVDLDTELRFKSTQPPVLLEIVVEDEHI